MEKISVEEKINSFRLSKDDKKKLVFLNDYVNKTLKKKKRTDIVITIDNMSMSEIKRYKSYILRVLKLNNINKSTYVVNNLSDLKNQCNGIVRVDFDSDDLSWRICDSKRILTKLITEALANNNILIMTSIVSLNEIKSFKESNILDTLPRISFHGEIDEFKEYKSLTNKYKNDNIECEIKLNDFSKIVQNISEDEFVKSYRISDYLYDYSIKNYATNNEKKININTFDSLINKDKEKDESKIELDNLVGLNNVKDELNKLFNYVKFLKDHNISREGTYLNMFFLGNPGTGKTMVANIIADKLYELGFIEKNEVVKVVPTDLIGEYVGQTRTQIRDILDKARGKLLFIDEAYLLYNNNYKNGNNPYMNEAIVELLKYLEDEKNITIFAGYKEEMMNIYKANPGIKSRIYKEITFEDYSIDELCSILCSDLSKKGFMIKEINRLLVQDYIKSIKLDKTFGNARTMKQLAQTLIINHATNYANGKTDDEMTITYLDIPKDNKSVRKEMGFGE